MFGVILLEAAKPQEDPSLSTPEIQFYFVPSVSSAEKAQPAGITFASLAQQHGRPPLILIGADQACLVTASTAAADYGNILNGGCPVLYTPSLGQEGMALLTVVQVHTLVVDAITTLDGLLDAYGIRSRVWLVADPRIGAMMNWMFKHHPYDQPSDEAVIDEIDLFPFRRFDYNVDTGQLALIPRPK